MSTSKLRQPNFDRVKSGSSSSSTDANSSQFLHAGQVANYTRQQSQKCLSSLTAYTRDNNAAYQEDKEDHGPENNNEDASYDHSVLIKDTTITMDTANKKNNDSPSLEQCIILLEPSLKIFQMNCIKNDKARAKRSKNESAKSHSYEKHVLDAGHEGSEEDEVPPQLLRLVRFFHYRWLPMKRALLRPWSSSVPTGGDGSEPCLEVSIHYRFRLARACWKKGLVAAAEYESLIKSADASGRKRRKGPAEHNSDNENGKIDNSKGWDENNSMERVRLALMRLPVDAIGPERSSTAWRHAKEMILECCAHWENDPDGNDMSETGEANGPSQLADWALTSWTALSLSQGMDCFAPVSSSTSSNQGHHHHHNRLHRNYDPVISVEKQLANILSNRASSPSSSSNPTLVLSRAVESRINDLLSPNNLSSLNGVHLYSLGRLFASFHSRDDAEMHIFASLVQCSSIDGMTCLEQLSRLLAVYSSFCCVSAIQTTMGNMSNTSLSRTSAKDIERRLFAKIDSEKCWKSIISKNRNNDGLVEKHQASPAKTKSFLEVVICTTAHLIKCSGKRNHK